MTTFLERRIPADVAPGASVAPRFNTWIKQLRGGGEYRNALWSQPLRTFSVTYQARGRARLEDDLQRFLMETSGSLIGFRVKDWSDYRVTDQETGVGDGVRFWFPLVKSYGAFQRRIFKPDTAEVTVKVAGATLDPDAYLVDVTNGVVIMRNAPSAGQIVTWSGTFDVPCRFEDDAFDVMMQTEDIGGTGRIGLREIRLGDTSSDALYLGTRDYMVSYDIAELTGMFTLLDTHVNTNWGASQ